MIGKMQDIIKYGSVSLFILAGISIWLIGRRPMARHAQKFRALTMGLWGFEPELETEQLRQNNIWNWRKLVWAGILICSLFTFTMSRKLSPSKNVLIGSCILVVWIVFLLLFWRYAIESDNSKANVKLEDNPSSSQKQSDGWLARSKASSGEDNRLPLTVITGFLGSGKTTLVKHLLRNTQGMKVLVVENEIGQEGVDHELLLQQTQKENIILMNNGCVCCTVRGDLIATFHELFRSESFSRIDWVVIETTGLADPAPVIQSLYMDKECARAMRLDGVLTVVDSKHVMPHVACADSGQAGAHGAKSIPEAVQQIAFADRVLLNKTDLVSDEELAAARGAVSTINPEAHLITSVKCAVPVEELLNIRAFDASRNAAMLNSGKSRVAFEMEDSGIAGDSAGSIDIKRSSFHIEVDAAGKIISGTEKAKKRRSGGRVLAESQPAPAASGAVSTLSLTCTEPLDLNAFNVWMAALLQEKGNDLYRLKGILHMKGYDRQFVVQGIHMLFNGELGPMWNDADSKKSKLVFIGVRLPHRDLKSGFEACIAKPPMHDSKSKED